MICKCGAHTRVVSSRPHADDPSVIVRRRHCEGCGKRFYTQEGTINIVQQRARKRVHRAEALAALGPDDRRRETAARSERRIRQYAREDAASQGRPM